MPDTTAKTMVIVVDDDPSISKAVGTLLRQHGFEPRPFNSADAVRRHGNFDHACCIILDVNLGDACGIELRRWLARSGVTVPVVFITGNDDHGTRKAAILSGCIAFLTKPFSAKSLIEPIEKACLRPAQRPPWRDRSSPEPR
jgi:FixJ family two-component response regulator